MNGNQERLGDIVAPSKEDNLLLWAIHKWPLHQRSYGALQVFAQAAGKPMHRLRDRWQVEALVENAQALFGSGVLGGTEDR